MSDKEEELDLFYNALNYRGASSNNAEILWKKLESCVARLVEEETKRCIQLVWDTENNMHEELDHVLRELIVEAIQKKV